LPAGADSSAGGSGDLGAGPGSVIVGGEGGGDGPTVGSPGSAAVVSTDKTAGTPVSLVAVGAVGGPVAALVDGISAPGSGEPAAPAAPLPLAEGKEPPAPPDDGTPLPGGDEGPVPPDSDAGTLPPDGELPPVDGSVGAEGREESASPAEVGAAAGSVADGPSSSGPASVAEGAIAGASDPLPAAVSVAEGSIAGSCADAVEASASDSTDKMTPRRNAVATPGRAVRRSPLPPTMT